MPQGGPCVAGGEGYVGGGVGSELFRLGFCEFKIPGFIGGECRGFG